MEDILKNYAGRVGQTAKAQTNYGGTKNYAGQIINNTTKGLALGFSTAAGVIDGLQSITARKGAYEFQKALDAEYLKGEQNKAYYASPDMKAESIKAERLTLISEVASLKTKTDPESQNLLAEKRAEIINLGEILKDDSNSFSGFSSRITELKEESLKGLFGKRKSEAEATFNDLELKYSQMMNQKSTEYQGQMLREEFMESAEAAMQEGDTTKAIDIFKEGFARGSFNASELERAIDTSHVRADVDLMGRIMDGFLEAGSTNEEAFLKTKEAFRLKEGEEGFQDGLTPFQGLTQGEDWDNAAYKLYEAKAFDSGLERVEQRNAGDKYVSEAYGTYQEFRDQPTAENITELTGIKNNLISQTQNGTFHKDETEPLLRLIDSTIKSFVEGGKGNDGFATEYSAEAFEAGVNAINDRDSSEITKYNNLETLRSSLTKDQYDLLSKQIKTTSKLKGDALDNYDKIVEYMSDPENKFTAEEKTDFYSMVQRSMEGLELGSENDYAEIKTVMNTWQASKVIESKKEAQKNVKGLYNYKEDPVKSMQDAVSPYVNLSESGEASAFWQMSNALDSIMVANNEGKKIIAPSFIENMDSGAYDANAIQLRGSNVFGGYDAFNNPVVIVEMGDIVKRDGNTSKIIGKEVAIFTPYWDERNKVTRYKQVTEEEGGTIATYVPESQNYSKIEIKRYKEKSQSILDDTTLNYELTMPLSELQTFDKYDIDSYGPNDEVSRAIGNYFDGASSMERAIEMLNLPRKNLNTNNIKNERVVVPQPSLSESIKTDDYYNGGKVVAMLEEGTVNRGKLQESVRRARLYLETLSNTTKNYPNESVRAVEERKTREKLKSDFPGFSISIANKIIAEGEK